jgi:hypothetical protein
VLLASASAITAGPAFAETPSFGPLPAILGREVAAEGDTSAATVAVAQRALELAKPAAA